MAKIKVTNGFHNTTGVGGLLTGTLIEGTVNVNDRLIQEDGFEIPIIQVEKIGTTIILTVPRQLDHVVVWHLMYGKTFEIKSGF